MARQGATEPTSFFPTHTEGAPVTRRSTPPPIPGEIDDESPTEPMEALKLPL